VNPFLLRYGPYLLAVAVIAGGIWGYGHWRYNAGQAEREAFYAPLLKTVREEAAREKARHEAQELESAALVANQEKRHVESEKTLRNRADAAERSYARILQDSAHRKASSCPGASAPAPESSGGAGIAQCAGELAAFARTIGERAVRDATRYAQCQDFYNAQRAIRNR
jgi:hypothetical protein